MSDQQPYQDSFTIGTASTGGAVKVYFDAENVDQMDKKIGLAKQAHKKAKEFN